MPKNPEAVALAEQLHALREQPIPSFTQGVEHVFAFVDLPQVNRGTGNVLMQEIGSEGEILSERRVSIPEWVADFRELSKPKVPRNLLDSVAGSLAYKAWYQHKWDTDPEFEAAF